MDEKQQNHKNSKIEHVFRDEESIRLLSQAFRGSFIERLILAILAALTIFGGFAVVAWAWHGDVSDKRLESELTQRNNIIENEQKEIEKMSDAQINYQIQATNLRNLIDKKLIICQKLKELDTDQKLSQISEQFSGRESYVAAHLHILDVFPNLAHESIQSARDLEAIYDKNINLPCGQLKSSDELGMHEKQNIASKDMLYKIQQRRAKLNMLITNKSDVLSSRLFQN